MSSARRCLVSGRVQGVFFRGATRSQARAYGVFGYARNLPDGRVEVHAEGAASAVDALCAWLWKGPPAAEVTSVECHPAAAAGYDDFAVQ
ncbi:MAG: acylphosphatase [Thiohalobacteraceae bacterium]